MTDLAGKVLFVTGASRGIGLAIALRAARDGARIAIAAKSDTPHPKLPGTIHTAAAEVVAAGGEALALAVDIRDEAQVLAAVAQTVATWGRLDVLVNNASAISLTGTLETPIKRFDLMLGVNVRGTYLCSQACLPHLLAAPNPHILTLAPPPTANPRWFHHHVAYSIAKYGMSLCVLGMAAEFRERGVGINALWPRTTIDTAAMAMFGGLVPRERCRTPAIVADAAHWILTQPSRECTGNFFLDEEVLARAGVTDLRPYAIDPTQEPFVDLFLD